MKSAALKQIINLPERSGMILVSSGIVKSLQVVEESLSELVGDWYQKDVVFLRLLTALPTYLV